MKTNKNEKSDSFELCKFVELTESEMNKVSGGELISEIEVLPDGRIVVRVGVN